MKRILILILALVSGLASAEEPAYRQFPGALLPEDVLLSDEAGFPTHFGDLMAARRPAILALIYFHCPALCGAELSDLFTALGQSGLHAGQDYDLFVISIDPKDGSRDASEARSAYVRHFPLPGAGDGWHFLTGDPEALFTIEHSVGFTARYEPVSGQYVHPAGVVILTPKRRVASYMLGVSYDGAELAHRVRDAGVGKIAPSGNPILLLCLHFDAASGRYSLDLSHALKLAVALTLACIGGTVILFFWRNQDR